MITSYDVRAELPTIITQRNLTGNTEFAYYSDFKSAYKGINCVAVWRIKYKSALYEAITRAFIKRQLFTEWSARQKSFWEFHCKLMKEGVEYMGDGSQFWSFQQWYKVQIGEIKLIA